MTEGQKEILKVAASIIDEKRREAEALIGVTLSALCEDLGIRIQEIKLSPLHHFSKGESNRVFIEVELGGVLIPRSTPAPANVES